MFEAQAEKTSESDSPEPLYWIIMSARRQRWKTETAN